jgi:predicted short-subunit dehydrogenase-like oxidoreductase (DUF2520 family)
VTGAVAIIGAGRVGLTLARALVLSGTPVRLLVREARRMPPGLPAPEIRWQSALEAVDLVIIAVPDDVITGVAQQLSKMGGVVARHVVLHTSGVRGSEALVPLLPSGAALGSIHPLQTFADAQGDPAALVGTPAVVEGSPGAVLAARGLAGALGMDPILELSADRKPLYHAAAVFSSNYVVTLAALAERLAREAGAGDASGQLFHALLANTVRNLGHEDPATALTGPIRRGDVGTVAAHLRVLSGSDRVLYVALAREALRLARAGGLEESDARQLERVLNG